MLCSIQFLSSFIYKAQDVREAWEIPSIGWCCWYCKEASKIKVKQGTKCSLALSIHMYRKCRLPT